MELKNLLKELGYDDYHANVLLALAKESPLDAKELTVASGVPIGRIYSVLLDLEDDCLVRRMAGPVDKFSAQPNDVLIRRMVRKNEEEIIERKKRIRGIAKSLRSGLNVIPMLTSGFEIHHYTKDRDYWPVYNKAVSILRKGDIYRIINSRRISDSLLDIELDGNPDLKKMVIQDNKMVAKGGKIHIVTNPESVVTNIQKELKKPELIKESVNKMLTRFSNKLLRKHTKITLAPQFKDLIIAIIGDNVFMEFYDEKTNSIASALHIKGKKIARDMAHWFDSIGNPVSYKVFEKEVKKYAK